MTLKLVERLVPFGNVLDVGCFCGDLLGMLPSRYKKYGIEPSDSARRLAEEKGIIIIARSLEELDGEEIKFDLIVLLDVVEHLLFPFHAMQKLSSLLNRGGLIALSTGNTDALPWRLMRTDYWYYFTEHVSFFNLKWFKWMASQLDLRIVMLEKFSHFEGSILERWRQLSQCLAFWSAKKCRKYGLLYRLLSVTYPFSKVKKWPEAPTTRLWRDHVFVVMKSE
ncbi:MAG: class I SAM-dependent methyltransferase [Deltaproteobacteria bacterium]|nr:class I SAM-dependent methyltransferase [Deltaproteobacteria bacterium]MBW2066218.1 class I SAM-dependent methyltransferase [Deltaproteobacteria bacterium]